MSIPNLENLNAAEAERLFARMKSYIGPSILVFFLYLLFYFPGLISNYIYRKEAKRMEHIAEQKLPGTGCLTTMFWLNILNIPLLIIALFFILLYALGKTIYKQFTSLGTLKEFAKTLALVSLVLLVIYSILVVEQSFYIYRLDHSEYFFKQSYEFAIIGTSSAIILSLGIWKNGWIKASISTLKKIAAYFVEGLTDSWQFVNANFQEKNVAPENVDVSGPEKPLSAIS